MTVLEACHHEDMYCSSTMFTTLTINNSPQTLIDDGQASA